MNFKNIFILTVLLCLFLPVPSHAAGQKMTKEEVMELHNEIKKSIDDAVEKTKGFIGGVTGWAKKLQNWSDKFDSLELKLQEIYDKDFDKQARDLQVIALIEKYETDDALQAMKINLKDDLKKTQTLGEALSKVGQAKRTIADKLNYLNEKAGELASKINVTEKTLEKASEYLKTAKTASKVYEALKPDANNAYRGLESIATILKEGASYFPPPLDKAVGAYAEITSGFVTALKALDSKIEANLRQGFVGLTGTFVEAFRTRYNNDPTGFRKAKEFTEIDPSEVYVDEIENSQPVYSLEREQVQEFGVSYGTAKNVYDHYLKILPLLREKTKTEVKIPLARFRIACQASRFQEELNRASELIQKDLRDSPGGFSFLNSFVTEYFDGDTASKVKSGIAIKALAKEEEEARLPASLRGEIGFSEGELGSVRGVGQEVLQALLSFRDDLDIKDLARKTVEIAQAALPKIAASIKKIDQLLSDPQYAKAAEELRNLQKRWWEASRFYYGLTKAENGLSAEDFPEEKNRVARFNYVLKGEFGGKIWKAATISKSGDLSTNLPLIPAEGGEVSHLKDLLLHNNPDRYKPLLDVLAGKQPHPLENEEIDRLLKEIDRNLSGYPIYKKSLDDWQKEQDIKYNELVEAARKNIGAAAKMKQEIEGQYSFKIVDPKLDPSRFDAAIKNRLSNLDGQKGTVANTYLQYAGPLEEFLAKAPALKAALKKANEVNKTLQTEAKLMEKENETYGRQIRKYMQILHHNFDLISSGYIPTPAAEKSLAEAKEKLAGVNNQLSEWRQKRSKMNEKAKANLFVYSRQAGESADRWMGLNDPSTTWNLENAESRLPEIIALVAERKKRNRLYQAQSEEERRKRAEEEAKKPYAEVPLASIRICSKPLSSGVVTITRSDLIEGKFVMEGSVARVKNGKVDFLGYTINDVDYGDRIKGGIPWKQAIEPDKLPKYDALKFALYANIGNYQSLPVRFTVNFVRPKEIIRSQMGSTLQESQLSFRLEKARKLFLDISTMNNYFKLAVAKNDITFAKSLYLAVLDRKDESVFNNAEAEDIYNAANSQGEANQELINKYKQVEGFNSDAQNIFAEIEKVLSIYVTDLANLKNASGNIGQDLNVEDVVAGRGPTPAGGGTASTGTSDWTFASYFDFSAGATAADPNQADLFLTPMSTAFPSSSSQGAIRDMGTADFSISPTLTPSPSEATITEGHFYAVLTTEGKYAKFKVSKINGSTSITIDWSYQPSGSTQF